jgi:DNA-binding XRE family transcriptional regulator
MSRRAARFTQADIARAIGAIEQTGANMAVEIGKDGTIRIVPLPLNAG